MNRLSQSLFAHVPKSIDPTYWPAKAEAQKMADRFSEQWFVVQNDMGFCVPMSAAGLIGYGYGDDRILDIVSPSAKPSGYLSGTQMVRGLIQDIEGFTSKKRRKFKPYIMLAGDWLMVSIIIGVLLFLIAIYAAKPPHLP